ncbi:MAG: RMD1 family protein [Granulosicoccaceae bacterium]|jgi:uncharacterized Rmd1/YagE family protein
MTIQDQYLEGRERMQARALYVGERIDLQALESTDLLGTAPLVVKAGANGCAVLFRFGAVVLFDLTPIEEVSFLTGLAHMVTRAVELPESEEVEISVDPAAAEKMESNVIYMHVLSIARLQMIAYILAKSVALAFYEKSIAGVVDRVEPLAANLQRKGTGGSQGKELLRHIGGTLLIQNKMIGRVEVLEKPELLWEHPELERLYLRLEDEYELSERHLALEKKMDLVSRTAETLIELARHRSTLRVEWYITILIVVEVIFTIYELFIRH